MPAFALSTGSLYTYGLARVFDLAAEAGFDAVEVLVDHRWDTRQAAYLQRLSHRTNLPVVALHSPFVPHVPGWPADPVGRLHSTATLAKELGAGVVVTHVPPRLQGARVEVFGSRKGPWYLPILLPASGDYRRFLFHELPDFEAAEGVLVGVENMPAKRILGRCVDIHVLNDVHSLAHMPHLTLDTTHLGTWGLDPLAIYKQLRERVVHVHLSNFNGRQHRLPEDGHLPLAELLQRLVRDSYRGAVTVELGPEALEAEDEGRVLAHLRQALSFCRENGAG